MDVIEHVNAKLLGFGIEDEKQYMILSLRENNITKLPKRGDYISYNLQEYTIDDCVQTFPDIVRLTVRQVRGVDGLGDPSKPPDPLDISVCEITPTGPKICNLLDENDPVQAKYIDMTIKHEAYIEARAELQKAFEEELGKAVADSDYWYKKYWNAVVENINIQRQQQRDKILNQTR